MSTYTQLFPSPPTFTEHSLIDLSHKVYLITGATSGTGLALAKILYNLHATVYIGARSLSKYNTAAETLRTACPNSKGAAKPFVADLADLRSIKPAVETFLKDEWRLDVLFLNAGVMLPPAGNKTKEGYDLEMSVHCVAPFLLATLLSPMLAQTATHYCHANASTRVVWVSSLLNLGTPAGGVQFDPSTGAPKQWKGMQNYMQSKAGVYFLAHEFATRGKNPSTITTSALKPEEVDHTKHTPSNSNPEGVQHITLNPGFTNTSLQRSIPALVRRVTSAVLKGPEYGAFTELYAGFGPDCRSGDFVFPWGREGSAPAHIVEGTVAKNGEVRSVSAQFYEWCEIQIRAFM
jgi:retinol dehydrogenase-12